MSEAENFYLLLELDPGVDDWEAIEKQLQEKQRLWSRDRTMGNSKAKRRAERNLALLVRMREVLKDPQQRREQARDARAQLAAKQKELLRELQEAITLLRAAGSVCSEDQLQRICQRFAATFSPDEIKKHLRAAGVTLETATASRRERHARATIDKVTAGNIQQNLEHLGLASLYVFLGLQPQSSPRALVDKAEAMYRESQRLGKTDADASARNSLAGISKVVFKSAEEKEKYDSFLATSALDGLKENLELAGVDGLLTRDEIDALVHQARQRGVPAEEARAYVEDYAADRKWVVQRDRRELPAEKLQQCGFCSVLAPADVQRCPGCGEALSLECPACGVTNPSSDAACSGCGCRIGDAPLVQGLLREAEELALQGDTAAALARLDKALLYWSGWQPAVAARARIERQHREREKELATLGDAVRERRLVAARAEVERLERKGLVPAGELKMRIEAGLRRAESCFAAGEQCRRDRRQEEALDHYEEALAACVDFEPAQAAMRASPPPPPSMLRVVSGQGFRLTWRPAETRRPVRYRVLRKRDGLPSTEEDGELVAEVGGAQIDDLSAAVGCSLYYAVFSRRAAVCSTSAATSGPHLRLAEVDNLQATPGDGEVTLSWQRPSGCTAVEVRRTEEIDGGHGGTGGTVLPSTGSSLVDHGLSNGRRYYYWVVALFLDPAQPRVHLRSAGTRLSVTPVAPPKPIEDLSVERAGRQVRLCWSPVAGAAVEIRQSLQEPWHAPGTMLPLERADELGSALRRGSAGSATIPLPEQARVYFTPLSVVAESAVVGRTVELIVLDPVTNLSARRAGNRIALTWEWPATNVCLVAWSQESFPGAAEAKEGLGRQVSRAEYDRAGCWILQGAEKKPYYFSVFAKAENVDLFSAAATVIESGGHSVTISYRVETSKALFSRAITSAHLELVSGNGDVTLPALLLVAKKRSVPVSPRDGEVVTEYPQVEVRDGRARLEVPQSVWGKRLFLKIFFKDARLIKGIRLLPADANQLQI